MCMHKRIHHVEEDKIICANCDAQWKKDYKGDFMRISQKQ